MIRLSPILLGAVLAALVCAGAPALGAPSAPDDRAAAPPAPEAETADPAQARAHKLDELYSRLAVATDETEVGGLVTAIDRLRLRSGSDTSDFLMARAVAAIDARDTTTSLALLDKIISLQPDWVEAWNKRATVRYLLGDDEASMSDIARVLQLDPRHFGALSGMGTILERRGFRDQALRAFQRALEVAPGLASLRASVDRLKAAVDGQAL